MKKLLFAEATSLALLFLFVCSPTAQAQEDEIIITGSPIAKSEDDIIIGASSMNKEELSQQLSGTIGETIKNEPGVSSTFFGPGASRPVIRGQSGNRVAILTDGLGALDASSASPDHAVSIDPASAERVEIIRGPGILRYGSAATGGVVNILDGRIKSKLPDQSFGANLRVGASSVDQGWEIAGASDLTLIDRQGQGLVLHIDAAKRKTDDYDIPGFAKSYHQRIKDGVQGGRDHLLNSATKVDSGAIALTWLGQRGNLGVAVKQTDSFYGVPGGDEQVSIDLTQIRYDMKGQLDIQAGPFTRLQMVAGYGDYRHAEIEDTGATGTVFTNQGVEGRIEALHGDIGGFEGALGVQFLDRDFAALGAEAFTPPTNTKNAAIYVFEDYDVGPILMEFGLRVEHSKHKEIATGQEIKFNATSLSIGGRYDLDGVASIGLTIFRNERAPAVEELFSDGPHLATNQYEVGNPDLSLETATGIEIAAHTGTEKTKLTLNIFNTLYDKFVYLAPTGTEREGVPVFQFMGKDARFSGFEASLEREMGSLGVFDFDSDVSIDFVRARLSQGIFRDLPQIPPMGGLVGLDADTGRISFRAELEWANRQNHIAQFETGSGSYSVANIYATWQPWKNRDDLKIRASMRNMFDEEVRQQASPLKDQVPLPGRNFKISIEASF